MDTLIMPRGKVETFKLLAEKRADQFQHVGMDFANGPDMTVINRIGGGKIDFMVVDDHLMKHTVDPVPPSRHRSKRILKKLRKRLGEPYEEDFMLMMHRKIAEAFAIDKILLEEQPMKTNTSLEMRMLYHAARARGSVVALNCTA